MLIKHYIKKTSVSDVFLIIWIYKYIIYIFICLFVCFFFCIQKTSKRLNRSGSNFLCDLTWPQGRFMNRKKLKNLCFKVFYICKFLKMREKILWNPQTFLFLFYTVRREDTDKATIKSWNRRWVRSTLLHVYYTTLMFVHFEAIS